MKIRSSRTRTVTYIPIAILVDYSSSTKDIREILNSSSRQMLQSMKQEVTFANSVKLLVVLYNHGRKTIVDLQTLEEVSDNALYIEKSTGATDTGSAILYALERLDEQKAQWKQAAQDYYQPLVFLMTDGYPDAGLNASEEDKARVEQAYQAAAAAIKSKEANGKIVFVAAGVQRKNGASANMKRLCELTSHPDRVLTLSDDDNAGNRISTFYNLILKATSNLGTGTPIDDLIGEILNG